MNPARRRGAAAAAAAVLAGLLAAPPLHAQDEVPFITTPDRVTIAMLEIAGVGARDHVIDLGSGDGRIVITAAKRFGATGLGVEIVPDLVVKSRANARAAGVAERAEFREQDLFATDLGRATVITMYLLPEVNLQLRPRLLQLAPGTRIVSHDWDLGDWAPERTLTLDVPEKAIGREKVSRVHLWTVPARVAGRWCASATAGDAAAGGAPSLVIEQRFADFTAVLEPRRGSAGQAPIAVFDGSVQQGTRLVGRGLQGVEMRLEGERGGERLVWQRGGAPALEGRRFTRAPAGGCG